MRIKSAVTSVEEFRGASGYVRRGYPWKPNPIKFYDAKRAALITSQNAEMLANNFEPIEVYYYKFPLIEAGAAETTLRRLAEDKYKNGGFTLGFVKDPRVSGKLVFPYLTRNQIINWHKVLEDKGVEIDYAEIFGDENFNGFSAELNQIQIAHSADIKFLTGKGISADHLVLNVTTTPFVASNFAGLMKYGATPELVFNQLDKYSFRDQQKFFEDSFTVWVKNGLAPSKLAKKFDIYLWIVENPFTVTKICENLEKSGRRDLAKETIRAALKTRREGDYYDPDQFPFLYGGYTDTEAREKAAIELFCRYVSRLEVKTSLHPDVFEFYCDNR